MLWLWLFLWLFTYEKMLQNAKVFPYLCVKTTWWFLVSLSHHIFLHNLSSTFALKCHNFSQSSFFHFFHNVHQIVMFISFPNLFLCIVLFCHRSIFTMFIFFLLIFLCCFFLMYSCVLNGFTIIPFSLILTFIIFQIINQQGLLLTLIL